MNRLNLSKIRVQTEKIDSEKNKRSTNFESSACSLKMSVKINIVEGSVKRNKFPEEKAPPSMEAVHHPDDRPWIGKKINLNEHFSRFSEKVKSSRVPGK